MFTASEAYKIESGKVTNSIKGMTLIGMSGCFKKSINGSRCMKLDDGVGTWARKVKAFQLGRQPTLKIDDITVGGTEI